MDMTTITIDPVMLQMGDPVIIDKDSGTVRAVDGPDHNGTFDIYLNTSNGSCHKIVRDVVRLVISE
jgi:hypothetical protein